MRIDHAFAPALLISFASLSISHAQDQPKPSVPSDSQIEFERKVKVLQLIWQDGESKTVGSDERKKYRDEFMTKSEFVRDLPEKSSAAPGIWMLRALASLEMDRSYEAAEAGDAMKRLGLETSRDEVVRNTFAALDRKGLLDFQRVKQDKAKANAAQTSQQIRAMRQPIIAKHNSLYNEYIRAIENKKGDDVTMALFKERADLLQQYQWLLPGKDELVSDTVPMPAPELYQAIAAGDLPAVDRWFATSGISIAEVECVKDVGDVSSFPGFTPLSAAARMGRRNIVARLLDKGAAVNATARLNRTALMEACEGGHLDVVQELLGRGADKSISSGIDNAQRIAKQRGYTDIANALRDRPRR